MTRPVAFKCRACINVSVKIKVLYSKIKEVPLPLYRWGIDLHV